MTPSGRPWWSRCARAVAHPFSVVLTQNVTACFLDRGALLEEPGRSVETHERSRMASWRWDGDSAADREARTPSSFVRFTPNGAKRVRFSDMRRATATIPDGLVNQGRRYSERPCLSPQVDLRDNDPIPSVVLRTTRINRQEGAAPIWGSASCA